MGTARCAWPASAGRPPEGVQLQPGDRHRGAGLGDELGAHLLAFGLQGLLQLFEAAPAEGVVGRPVGLVERPPGRGDGLRHVLVPGVGDAAEHFLGRGVDVVEELAGRRFDELAVDEHAAFRCERTDAGLDHLCYPSVGADIAGDVTVGNGGGGA